MIGNVPSSYPALRDLLSAGFGCFLQIPKLFFVLLRGVRDFGGAAFIVGAVALWELGSFVAEPRWDHPL
jgi:hypothetical protein